VLAVTDAGGNLDLEGTLLATYLTVRARLRRLQAQGLFAAVVGLLKEERDLVMQILALHGEALATLLPETPPRAPAPKMDSKNH